ncbi:hypothetical protein BGZ52_004567 [Haplosporangium bisporale]|nr:hypothetical protein BGZ52_004567 [Haplosporangium bisporale]
MRHPHSSSRLISSLLALFLAISSVHANINCALPAGGIYSAGDPMVLNWGDDGAKPTVANIISMTGALYCNTGNKIADIPITKFTGPANYTVPSVGNATLAGGNAGLCAGNAFHIEYSGQYMGGILDLFKTAWGPATCGTMTINPSPNNTMPTTTPTTIASTTTTTTTTTATSKKPSSSTTTSPTETPDQPQDSNKGKTTIIIVGIVAGLILVLLFSGFIWHTRRQKIRRMESAIMPWSNQPNNNFSKMSSSMDDGPRSPGKLAAGAGAGVAAAAAVNYANKAQPAIPAPSHGEGGYYNDDRYGYQQGYNNTPNNNYHQQHQGGYDGYEDDTYYNPHYASQNNQGYGQGQVQGYEMNQFNNGSYYSASNASRTPYQDPYKAQQPAVSSPGYFPPPPPVTGASSPPPSVPLTVPISSTTTLTSSSSPKRGPQTILPEMGRPADEPTSPRS